MKKKTPDKTTTANKRFQSWVTILALITLIAFGWHWVIPRLAGSSRPKIPLTRITLEQFAAASKQYFSIYGSWPTGIADFYPAGNKQHLLFISDAPTAANDAWKHPIYYQPFDAEVGYGKVVSFGRDGKVGGAGADSDIELKFTGNQ